MASPAEVQLANKPSAALDGTPAEVIDAILSHIRPHDLMNLSATSKWYREVAQSVIWRDIELHRQETHEDYYCEELYRDLPRAWLDEELRDPWSYRGKNGVDDEFTERNAEFGKAIQMLNVNYREDQARMKLAPCLRHVVARLKPGYGPRSGSIASR